MRRTPAILAACAIIVLLLVAGAWLLPPALDWNRFRPEIASLASDALGRRVSIDGPVTLALLPEPVFTAGKVSVAAADGAQGGMTAAELRVGVTFDSLFSGRVSAREVVLRGVELRVPWPPPTDALVFSPPPWLASLSARVERATVVIGGLVLSGVDATLSTTDGTGTYNVAGTATISGRNWRFAAQLSRPGGDGASGLTLTLDGQGAAQGVGLRLSGQVTGEGAFSGRIAGRGSDLSQLLPGPAVPFRAEGRLSVAGGLAVADELTGELGGVPVRGALALRASPATRLDLALTASRLDLDGWWAALLRQGDADALPPFPVGIDLSAEVAQFAGGTMRGIRAAFDLAGGVAELRELSATLPGEAAVRAAGRFTLPAPHRATPARLGFDGYVAVTALAPRTTLAWLTGAMLQHGITLPDGVLRQAQLAGHIVYTPGQVTIDNLTGLVDDGSVSGSLGLAIAARPALAVNLKLGRIDLDPLLPPRWPGLPDIAAGLGGFDADLKLEADAVAVAGFTAAAAVLDAQLKAGRLDVRRFAAAVGGVRLAGSGTLGEGGRINDGKLTIQAAADALLAPSFLPLWPAPLLRAVPAESPIWHAPLDLTVQAAGAAGALGLKLQGTLGDLQAEFSPTINLGSGQWSGSLTLRHPGAPRLAESLGLSGATAWLGDGSLGLVAQLAGQTGRTAAESFDIAAGALHAAGNLVLATTATGHALTGRIKTETLPLPLPPLRSSNPLPAWDPGGWEGNMVLEAAQVLLGGVPVLADARADIGLSGGMLRISGITAKLGGGVLKAELGIDTLAEPPPVTLHADLQGVALPGPLFDLPFDLTAGVADATANLTASGHSPRALLATLGGQIKLDMRDGVLSGIALPRPGNALDDDELRASLAGGSTGFDRLDADLAIDHGVVSLHDTTLAGRNGTIVASGLIDLSGGTEELRLDLRPNMENPPRIGLGVRGDVTAPQRTPDIADVSRWRAAHAP